MREDVRVKPSPSSDQPEWPSTTARSNRAGRIAVTHTAGRAAARIGWDADAERYQREHGDYLAGPGDGDLVWCPEGWLESELGLLGPAADLAGLTVLDLGCGAAQAARWLAKHVCGVSESLTDTAGPNASGEVISTHLPEPSPTTEAASTAESAHTRARRASRAPSSGRVIGMDISHAQLTFAQDWHEAHPSHPRVHLIQADAHDLPFATASMDVIVSAFGVLAFVPDLTVVLREVARVLRPDGHITVSLPHPVRWMFPDDPVATRGLKVSTSYFDRTPYAEISTTGEVTYAEYHHTLEDLMHACVAAGLVVTRLWEPQWRGDRMRTFGGWSADTVDLVPKTLIVRLEHRSLQKRSASPESSEH